MTFDEGLSTSLSINQIQEKKLWDSILQCSIIKELFQ